MIVNFYEEVIEHAYVLLNYHSYEEVAEWVAENIAANIVVRRLSHTVEMTDEEYLIFKLRFL